MSSILRQADQGYTRDYFQLIQEVGSREALIAGLLSVRTSAISQRPVVVEPNKKDARKNPDRANSAASFCQYVLDDIRLMRREGDHQEYYGGLSALVEQITLTCFYGVRNFWPYWDVLPGDSYPKPIAIEVMDERRFWHDIQTDELYLATEDDYSKGICLSQVDPALSIVARNFQISRQLAMSGIARSVLLPWYLRFNSYKDFVSYIETWSKPSLVAKRPNDLPGAYSESVETTMQNLLEDWLGDTRALLPSGFEVEVVEAVKGGEAVFDSVDKMTERHLQFAIVGQVGTVAGDATTYASSGAAQQIRDDIADKDTRFVSEILERLLSHAVAVAFGSDCPTPHVTFEQEQSVESYKARALAMQSAIYPLAGGLPKGIPIDIVEYCKLTGIPLRADGLMDPKWFANIKAITEAGIGTGGSEQKTQSQLLSQNHTGIMVALYPSAEVQGLLAQPGGEPPEELHITLCYFGDAANYPYAKTLARVVSEWAAQQTALQGEVQGCGVWGDPGEFVLWASVDIDGLAEARTNLYQRLKLHGVIGKQEHDFSAHMTLAYTEEKPVLPDLPHVPLYFDRVCLVVGGNKTWFNFSKSQ